MRRRRRLCGGSCAKIGEEPSGVGRRSAHHASRVSYPDSQGIADAQHLRSLEGEVVELGAELSAAPAKLAELMSQCNDTRECMNMLVAERDTAAARQITAIGNLQATEVVLHAFSRDATTTMRRVSQMEALLINLCT